MAELLVADAHAEGGVKALIDLAEEKKDDVEVLSALFERLSDDCTGSEDSRAMAYAQDAILKALSAMKLFQWQPALQVSCLKFLTSMAAEYAKAAGKQGAVESTVATMRASADSYQVQLHGVKALGLLVKERDNLVRARVAGADEVLENVVDMHSSDGQLVFRAKQVLGPLESITEAEAVEQAAKVPVSSKSPWAKLKNAVFTGKAQTLAEGMLPGMHGISGQVAAKMKEGVKPLLDYMVERMRSPEAVRWCCDALATICAGNAEVRAEIMSHKGAARLCLALRRHKWDEDVCAGACMAMTALASDHAKECGEAGAVELVLGSMKTSGESYQVQTRGTQALTALTRGYAPNMKAAVEMDALSIVRAALDSNPDDGQLQWRGINLLDALKPGQGEDVRKRALERSFSSFLKRKDSKAQMGGSFVERKPGQPKSSATAMDEVDEMAEMVEEDEDDEDEEDK
jgi:hypothetical protein